MMTDRKEPFNLIGMAGLGWRKKTPEQKKYATFNRRMFAATLDSALIMFTFAPLVDSWFTAHYGAFPVDMMALQEKLAGMDPNEANRAFVQAMIEEGGVRYWVNNLAAQTTAYLGLSGICWHFWSATPGKMVMRIKVVDAKTEQPISDLQIFFRLCGYLMSAAFFMIGFFWIGIDKRKQAWHDKFAGTVVVVLPWKKPKSGSEAAGPSDSPAP